MYKTTKSTYKSLLKIQLANNNGRSEKILHFIEYKKKKKTQSLERSNPVKNSHLFCGQMGELHGMRGEHTEVRAW